MIYKILCLSDIDRIRGGKMLSVVSDTEAAMFVARRATIAVNAMSNIEKMEEWKNGMLPIHLLTKK